MTSSSCRYGHTLPRAAPIAVPTVALLVADSLHISLFGRILWHKQLLERRSIAKTTPQRR
jgi:hypothetical protein